MTPTDALPAPWAKLIRRREVADRTVAFEFEKPHGWTFKAGQAVDVTLVEPPESDGEGNIAHTRGNQQGFLAWSTGNGQGSGSAFKCVLSAMPSGAKVKVEGPFGNPILDNNR